eukprot:905163-Pyramimonas_sp.AAC.1
MDCDEVAGDPDPVVLFGFNPVNNFDKESMTQDTMLTDFRMYIGAPMTDQEVHRIAFSAVETANETRVRYAPNIARVRYARLAGRRPRRVSPKTKTLKRPRR